MLCLSNVKIQDETLISVVVDVAYFIKDSRPVSVYVSQDSLLWFLSETLEQMFFLS